MGHPDGARTHGSGGSGLGEVIVMLAVALLGPAVAAAVAELLHVLLIAAGVIVGVGAASLVGLIAWRWRSRKDAARAMPPRTLVARAAPPLPQARRAAELPAAPQRETPGGPHLHFHGLDAAQIAAIIAREQEGDVNPGS